MHASREVARDVRALGKIAAAAIQQSQPRGPYVLLGHSSGGLVAYETAQLLAADGERVDLVVIARRDLPAPARRSPVTRRRLVRAVQPRWLPHPSHAARVAVSPGSGTDPPERCVADRRRRRAAAPFVPGSTDVVLDRESVEWREGTWARRVPRAVGPVLLLRTREGRAVDAGVRRAGLGSGDRRAVGSPRRARRPPHDARRALRPRGGTARRRRARR